MGTQLYPWIVANGEIADCGALFSLSLDERDIPSLESVDEELRAVIDAIATTGIAGLAAADTNSEPEASE